jgi:hypothetical protein
MYDYREVLVGSIAPNIFVSARSDTAAGCVVESGRGQSSAGFIALWHKKKMTNEPYADQISAATGGARETAAPEIRGSTDSTSVVIDSTDIRRGEFRSFAHRDTLHIFALGIPSGMINHHPWKKSHSPLFGFALTAEFDRR